MAASKILFIVLAMMMVLNVQSAYKMKKAFPVNDKVEFDEGVPSLAGLSNEGFVAAWISYDSVAGTYAIHGRFYGEDAEPTTADVVLVKATTNSKSKLKVSQFSNGNCILVWEESSRDGSGLGIFTVIFDTTGKLITAETQVNTQTTSTQSGADVACPANGDCIITWYDLGVNSGDIKLRRIKQDGTFPNAEVTVNTNTAFNALTQETPAITLLPNNKYLIAWNSLHANTKTAIDWRVMGDGDSVSGDERTVLSSDKKNFIPKGIAGLADGNVALIYRRSDTTKDRLFGTILNTEGKVIVEEFRISNDTFWDETEVKIAALEDKGFVVAFKSEGTGSHARWIRNEFNTDGTPIYEEKGEIYYETEHLDAPFALAVLKNGDYVIAYQGEDRFSNYGVLGLLFKPRGLPPGIIFIIVFFPTIAVLGLGYYLHKRNKKSSKGEKKSKKNKERHDEESGHHKEKDQEKAKHHENREHRENKDNKENRVHSEHNEHKH